MGGDTVFHKKEVEMSSAIARLLDNPAHCRDALKVLAHLVSEVLPHFVMRTTVKSQPSQGLI